MSHTKGLFNISNGLGARPGTAVLCYLTSTFLGATAVPTLLKNVLASVALAFDLRAKVREDQS